MPTPESIRKQVQQLTEDLISLGLCNHQNFPSIRDTAGHIREIGFSHDHDLSIVLKNLPYKELYEELERTEAYNLKMVDGALVQMSYRFINDQLNSHRLSFYPSPNLEEYQNNPEIYENDEMYADIINKNVVPFPLRFDYNSREEIWVELGHSRSHLTLGQYANCRIPVSSPLTPFRFISFILRNFYNTAYIKFCQKIRKFNDGFSETISREERNVIYIQVPNRKFV